MMFFFREHKALVILFTLSLLVLVAGLFMIQSGSENPTASEAPQEATAASANAEQVVATMNYIADSAEQQLKAQQSEHTTQGIADIKPQESLDRVAALNGRIPEIGSDDWCEVMMVKDADKWTQEEQSLFAKHCL